MKRCFEGASPSGCGGCRPRGGTGGTPWRAWGPPRGWPTGRGVARMLGGLAGWHPGLDSSIRGLVGRPLWGRRAADEGRRLARGYSFRIKRIPPRASHERWSGGISNFPPDNPLETTKGEACGPLLWKPLGGWTGERGLRGTVGRGFGAGCVGSFRGFRLGGDEGIGGLVVLAPGLGGWGPAGDGGRGMRHAGGVVPYGGLRKASSTTPASRRIAERLRRRGRGRGGNRRGGHPQRG